MKETLSKRVENIATNWLPSYNLKQNADKKLHYNICKKLHQLSTEHDFPMGVLVYIAVGTNAHRTPIFEQGYKTLNEKKALTIIKWCEQFAKYHRNPSFRTYDRVVHALSKFYDKYSTKTKDFTTLLKKLEKYNKEQYRNSILGNTKELYELLVKGATSEI